MSDVFTAMAAPFSRDAVSWRAQSVTKDGTKAMALAYIDARDVMRRLDEVVGPANWQDEYHETPTGTAICTIRIRVDGEWVGKSDGAGATDVEAEKGRLSDAFKRCAVKWGIGRYLYDLDSPWVPCESYGPDGGKKQWRKWTADPWQFVRCAPAPAAVATPAKAVPVDAVAAYKDDQMKRLDAMMKRGDVEGIRAWPAAEAKALTKMNKHHPEVHASLLRFQSDLIAQTRAAG